MVNLDTPVLVYCVTDFFFKTEIKTEIGFCCRTYTREKNRSFSKFSPPKDGPYYSERNPIVMQIIFSLGLFFFQIK